MSPELLNLWVAYLVSLGRVTSFSQRLRRLTIYPITSPAFHRPSRLFEPAGAEGIIMLLDRLGIGIDDVPDMDDKCSLLTLLAEVVGSPEGRRSLSYPYWELILELALGLVGDGALNDVWLDEIQSPERRTPRSTNYEVMQVMVSLEEAQEWDKLECWMGFVWYTLWCLKTDLIPEDVERVTLSLLRQRPGAAKKLERQLQRVTVDNTTQCLEHLQRVCEQAGLESASRQNAS